MNEWMDGWRLTLTFWRDGIGRRVLVVDCWTKNKQTNKQTNKQKQNVTQQ